MIFIRAQIKNAYYLNIKINFNIISLQKNICTQIKFEGRYR